MGDERLAKAAYTLTHHGVKGMKWGVRKDQHREYSAKATKSTENKIQRLQAQVTLARNTSRGVKIKTKRKLDENWYNALSTKKEHIPKGAELKRIARAVDGNTLNGRLYVSQLKTDHNIYAGTIPAVQSKSGARGSKNYHSVY